MNQIQNIKINRAPAPQTRADADTLAKYRNALERTAAGLWSISDQRAPAGADRQALETRLAALEQSEGRTAAATIAGRVARLFLRFPSSRLTDATAEATIAAYAQDLEQFPLWAVDQAMLEAIRKGGAFAPSSPELRKACERAVASSRAEAAEIRAVLHADVYREPSADERERARAGFEELIADLKLREDNHGFKRPDQRPLSRPEAQAWLERYAADPPPLPMLSDSARKSLGLPAKEGAAA
jgi:hypothetical protein